MTETIKGTHDVTVRSVSPITNFAGEDELEVKRVHIEGAMGQPEVEREESRALLLFDVEQRAGYEIINATLDIYVTAFTAGDDTTTIQVLRVGEPWDVERVSWNEQPAIEGAALSTQTPAGGWRSLGVTDAVQRWEDGREPNRGLLVRCTPGAGTGPQITFRSSEHADPDFHPRLTVTYVVSPPNAPVVWPHGNVPAGEAFDVNWFFSHNDPNAVQTAYQVEISRVSDEVVEFDTTKTSSASDSHTVPSSTLTDGVEYRVRVKTWGPGDEESPWSTFRTFRTSARPVVTIHAPTAAQVLDAASKLVTWSSDQDQEAYRVALLTDEATPQMVSDTGRVSSSELQHLLTELESDGYTVEVTSYNQFDVASAPATRDFSVTWDPTPVPIITVLDQSDSGRASIQIDNGTPGVGESTPVRNEVYRRQLGGDWELVAANVAVDGAFQDYTIAAWVPHEYRVRAVAENGAWSYSTESSTSIGLLGVWLHDPLDPPGTIEHFLYDGQGTRNENYGADINLMHFHGRTGAVAEATAQATEDEISFTIQLPSGTTDRARIRALSRGRSVLCYRDVHARRAFGVITDLRINDEPVGGSATVTLGLVDQEA